MRLVSYMDTMTEHISWQLPSTKEAIWRGIKGKCPKCAEGKLYRAYLKPVDNCASCGHKWVDVRADDAPAWLTILITGHVVAPFFHFFMNKPNLPVWIPGLILSLVAIVISLILLPRTKGGFIGLIWKKGIPTS